MSKAQELILVITKKVSDRDLKYYLDKLRIASDEVKYADLVDREIAPQNDLRSALRRDVVNRPTQVVVHQRRKATSP
jgi:hypothetical protein